MTFRVLGGRETGAFKTSCKTTDRYYGASMNILSDFQICKINFEANSARTHLGEKFRFCTGP